MIEATIADRSDPIALFAVQGAPSTGAYVDKMGRCNRRAVN